ncbi:PAS domain-containing protein, partial [Shigella flexneri]|uniref:PAS domain-containing protein n=1 Tax=Shigella flexneri TaxID=623 RepID=UPI00209520A6
FFLTNSAPMLLIDPSRDGQIVDANLAALNFYGYNHETEPVIIFEGIEAPATLGLKASRSANYQRKKQGFYARFFLTNSAPMLLIDPSRDGQIVDANLAALNFYGY